MSRVTLSKLLFAKARPRWDVPGPECTRWAVPVIVAVHVCHLRSIFVRCDTKPKIQMGRVFYAPKCKVKMQFRSCVFC